MSVGNVTQYTITGLQEFSAYILTITASIGVGSSPPASVLVNKSSAGELDDLITRSGVGLWGDTLPSSHFCSSNYIFMFYIIK